MVAISLSGSGEGPGWETAPGYSTTAFSGSSRFPVMAGVLEGDSRVSLLVNRKNSER